MKSGAKTRKSTSFFARLPWAGFGITLFFLVLIAVAADRVTMRLESDEEWVSHSQDVERIVGRLRGDFLAGEADRLLYLATGNETRLEPYYSVSKRIPEDIAQLKALTTGNAVQEKRLEDLRVVIGRRDGALTELVALKKKAGETAQQQSDLAEVAGLSNRAMDIIQQMRGNEDAVLKQRQTISRHGYELVRFILVAAFIVVMLMLAILFRQLWAELRERMQAEGSVRKLNVRILQLQDTERRKVARELHDSIGQVFAAMKMNLTALTASDSSLSSRKREEMISELQKLLEMGVTETRTLSHLLHPPLLDELGFASAARWLTDGFSERSRIQVNLEIPSDLPRMSQEVELVLFRVLQESLTNIHRHSGSSTADIRVASDGNKVKLSVRDYGTGIPSGILENFRTTSVGLGVGLAGMRERVSELGGALDLYSDLEGTVLNVSLPLVEAPPLEARIEEELHATPRSQPAPNAHLN